MEENRTGFWKELWSQISSIPRSFKEDWKAFTPRWGSAEPKDPISIGGRISLTGFLSLARLVNAFTEASQASMVQRQIDLLRDMESGRYRPPEPREGEKDWAQREGYELWKGEDGLWYRKKGDRVEVYAPDLLLRRTGPTYLLGRVLGAKGDGDWVPVDTWLDQLRAIRAQYEAALSPEQDYPFEEMAKFRVWDREGLGKALDIAEYFGLAAVGDPLTYLTLGLSGGARLAGSGAEALSRLALEASRGATALRMGAEAASVLGKTLSLTHYVTVGAQDLVALPFVAPVWLLTKAAQYAVVPVIRPVMRKGQEVLGVVWTRVTELTPVAQLLTKLRDMANLLREMEEKGVDPYLLHPGSELPEGEAGYVSILLKPKDKDSWTEEEVRFYSGAFSESLKSIFSPQDQAGLDIHVRLPQPQVVDGQNRYPFLVINVPARKEWLPSIQAATELIVSSISGGPPPGASTYVPPQTPPPTPGPRTVFSGPPPGGRQPFSGVRRTGPSRPIDQTPPGAQTPPSFRPGVSRLGSGPRTYGRYQFRKRVRGDSVAGQVGGEIVPLDQVLGLVLETPETAISRAIARGEPIPLGPGERSLVPVGETSLVPFESGEGSLTPLGDLSLAPYREGEKGLVPVGERALSPSESGERRFLVLPSEVRIIVSAPTPELGPGAPIPLPEGTVLALPSGERIALPPGTLLALPPGEKVRFEPGKPVSLPPRSVLYPPRGATFSLPSSLPEGTGFLSLPPGEVLSPALPPGEAPLALPEGVLLALPEGSRPEPSPIPLAPPEPPPTVIALGPGQVLIPKKPRRQRERSSRRVTESPQVGETSQKEGIPKPEEAPEDSAIPVEPQPPPRGLWPLDLIGAGTYPVPPESIRAKALAVDHLAVLRVPTAPDIPSYLSDRLDLQDIVQVSSSNLETFLQKRLGLREAARVEEFERVGREAAQAAWLWREGDPGPIVEFLSSLGYRAFVSGDRVLVPLAPDLVVVISRATRDFQSIFRNLVNLAIDLLRFPGLSPRDVDKLSSAQSILSKGRNLSQEQKRVVALLDRILERLGMGERNLAKILKEGVVAPSVFGDPVVRSNLQSLINGAGDALRSLADRFQGAVDVASLSLVRPSAVDARAVAAADALLHGNRVFSLLARAMEQSSIDARVSLAEADRQAKLVAYALGRFLRGHNQVRVQAFGTYFDGRISLTFRISPVPGEERAFSNVIAAIKHLFGEGKLAEVRGKAPLAPELLQRIKVVRGKEVEETGGPFVRDVVSKISPDQKVTELELSFKIWDSKDLEGLLTLFSNAVEETQRERLVIVGKRIAAKLAKDAALGGLISKEEADDLIRAMGLVPERTKGFQEEEESKHLVRRDRGAEGEEGDESELLEDRKKKGDEFEDLSILLTGARDPQDLLAQAPLLPLIQSSFLDPYRYLKGVEAPDRLPKGMEKAELVEYAAFAALGDPFPLRVLAEAYGVPSSVLDESEGSGLDALIVQVSGLESSQAQVLLQEVSERVQELERFRVELFREKGWNLPEDVDDEEGWKIAAFHRQVVRPLRGLFAIGRRGVIESSPLRGEDWLKPERFVQLIAQAVLNYRLETDPFRKIRFRIGKALDSSLQNDFSWIRDWIGVPVQVVEGEKGKALLILSGKEAPVLPAEVHGVIAWGFAITDDYLAKIDLWKQALAGRPGAIQKVVSDPDERLLLGEIETAQDLEGLQALSDSVSALVLLEDPEPLRSYLVSYGGLTAELAEKVIDLVSRDLLSPTEKLFQGIFSSIDSILFSSLVDRNGFERRLELVRGALAASRNLADYEPLVAQYLEEGREAIVQTLDRVWGEEFAPSFDALERFENLRFRVQNWINEARGEGERVLALLREQKISLEEARDRAQKVLQALESKVRNGLRDDFRRLSRFFELREIPFREVLAPYDDALTSLERLVASPDRNLAEALLESFRVRITEAWDRVRELGFVLADSYFRNSEEFWNRIRNLFSYGLAPFYPGARSEAIRIPLPEQDPLEGLKTGYYLLTGTTLDDAAATYLHNVIESSVPWRETLAQASVRADLPKIELGEKIPYPFGPRKVSEVETAPTSVSRVKKSRFMRLIKRAVEFQKAQERLAEKIEKTFTRLGPSAPFDPSHPEMVRVSETWRSSLVLRRLSEALERFRGSPSLQALGAGIYNVTHGRDSRVLEGELSRILRKKVSIDWDQRLVVIGEGDEAKKYRLSSVLDPVVLTKDIVQILNRNGIFLSPRELDFLYGKAMEPALPFFISPKRILRVQEVDPGVRRVKERVEQVRKAVEEAYKELGIDDPLRQPVLFRDTQTAFYRNRIEDKVYVETYLGYPERGSDQILVSADSGAPIASGYNRIVYTDEGPFFEILPDQVLFDYEPPAYLAEAKTRGAFVLSIPDDPGVRILYQDLPVREFKRPRPREDLGESVPYRPEGIGDFVPGRFYIRVFADNENRSLTVVPLEAGLSPSGKRQARAVGGEMDPDEILSFPKVFIRGKEVWNINELSRVIPNPEDALLELLENSPYVRALAREIPEVVADKLRRLGERWVQAWEKIVREAVVPGDYYEALGPEIADSAAERALLGELVPALVDAFRVLEMRPLGEPGLKERIVGVALEQGDVPEGWAQPILTEPHPAAASIHPSAEGEEGSRLLMYEIMANVREELLEVEEKRRLLFSLAEQYYAEELGKVALEVAEFGQARYGTEIRRRAIERATLRIYRMIRQGCELGG